VLSKLGWVVVDVVEEVGDGAAVVMGEGRVRERRDVNIVWSDFIVRGCGGEGADQEVRRGSAGWVGRRRGG
jgi:hypothetical protein